MKEQTTKQKEDLFTPNCIRTVTGLYVNVFDPKPEMFCIEDIAHSLSFQCRFGGHLPYFYSVAQHSLNCSYLIKEDEHKFAALMHDASEAYLMDLPRPIKANIPEYKAVEDKLLKVIAAKFGFVYPFHEAVKKVDESMLRVEWDALMLKGYVLQTEGDMTVVKDTFLKMFYQYKSL